MLEGQSAFNRDDRGNVATLFALVLATITAIAGAAVDGVRWFNACQASARAIDASLLAGARAMQLDGSQSAAALEHAQTYYRANRRGTIPVVDDTVRFVIGGGGAAITFTGTAYIETTLLNVIGISKLQVTKPAAAAFSSGGLNNGSDLEISLALDVTSSMCDDGLGPCTSGTKITGLKDASKDLVNIVLSGASASGLTSRIAIVPFSTSVRVSTDGNAGAMMTTLTNLAPTWTGYLSEGTNCTSGAGGEASSNGTCTNRKVTYYPNFKLRPCVTDRYYDASDTFDLTDAAPGPGRWLNGDAGTRMPVSKDSSDTLAKSRIGVTAADPMEDWNYTGGGVCSDVPNSNVIVPLTSNQSALSTYLDGMTAFGSTSGALASAWSYYLLSPNWSAVWSMSSKPGSYGDLTAKKSNGAPVLRKVAVIMTDGDYNTARGWKDEDQKKVSEAAAGLCSNMKANGIEIYTIGFALDLLPAAKRTIAEDTLKQCGTDVSHFYASLTVADLKAAFRDIALKVSPIRLTQ